MKNNVFLLIKALAYPCLTRRGGLGKGRQTMSYHLLPLLAPLLLLSIAAFAARGDARAAGRLPRVAEYGALASVGIALLSALMLGLYGPGSSALLGAAGVGLSVRLDIVSATMLVLVSFIGWVVLRYSATYMDREPHHARFTALMLATLAAVLVLVIAGNLFQLLLAWGATSVALHRLLLFYPQRVTAQRAARKKAVLARASEAALALAVLFLAAAYETSDIATILSQARNDAPTLAAAGLLALAAVLASAQFPGHGWLTEVMEAPTPVSALLHAGVINAGGFLLIRFADVMLSAPAILAGLVMLGGFTALFGGLVMLTQAAVKTSLAWSTIAQMGFMMLQCGLALFPLALLHIVAHSLYKAHAFLSAGEAVRNIAAIARPGPVAVPSLAKVLRAFWAGIVIYGLVSLGVGVEGKSPQSLTLGVILIFGVAYILAQGFADTAPAALTKRTAIYALATSVAYVVLQKLANVMTAGTLPIPPTPGALEWVLLALALVSFGAVALAQATFPLWASHPAAVGLRVHLSNGLYANAIFDRLLGGWRQKPTL